MTYGLCSYKDKSTKFCPQKVQVVNTHTHACTRKHAVLAIETTMLRLSVNEKGALRDSRVSMQELHAYACPGQNAVLYSVMDGPR